MSDKLAAWNVQEADFSLAGNTFDQMKALLRYAILAPSGPNTQPWKFSIKDNEVSLIADLSRSLPSVDPTDRTLYISHGCLLTNLLIASEHFGFAHEVKCQPDGPSGNRTTALKLDKKAESSRFP